MARPKIDRIDRKILKTLQEEGRISNVALAKKAGISAPPCLRRVRALEREGFIRGYHARLDPVSLGYGMMVFVTIKLSSHAEKDLAKFEKRVNDLPAVRACYTLTGETDFLLKVAARNWEEYQEFLQNELTTAPNVMLIKSSPCIRTVKDEPGIPVEE